MVNRMTDLFWRLAAKLLAQPKVVDWLIRRAMKTPYTHIVAPDGREYMRRYWLFNPYPADSSGKIDKWRFPISIRLHHILLPDQDRAYHDHPWNARTIILRGGYAEVRLKQFSWEPESFLRFAGDTATLKFGEFHYITSIAHRGVWTLFIVGKFRGEWGFLVGGKKVAWRKFLGLDARASNE